MILKSLVAQKSVAFVPLFVEGSFVPFVRRPQQSIVDVQMLKLLPCSLLINENRLVCVTSLQVPFLGEVQANFQPVHLRSN